MWIFVQTHTLVYVHMYAYIHMNIQKNAYTHKYMCMYIVVCIYTRAYLYVVCVNSYAYTYIYIFTQPHTRTLTYTYTNTHRYICIFLYVYTPLYTHDCNIKYIHVCCPLHIWSFDTPPPAFILQHFPDSIGRDEKTPFGKGACPIVDDMHPYSHTVQYTFGVQ